MNIKVAILGAKGRMGSESVKAIDAASDLDLVATLDLGDSLEELKSSKAEVVLDFTNPDAVMKNIEFAVDNGIHVVVGTSGFTSSRVEQVKLLLAKSPKVGVVIAPNFGLGAVLMMQFAAKAATYFESVEIIELHHPDKADAPSGTALRTAELIADSRARAKRGPMPDKTSSEITGARGARVNDVPIHSIRLRGLVAHQEVLLGDQGETLLIRHDSIDRSGFMPGVLLAIRGVKSRAGLTFGLENLMEL